MLEHLEKLKDGSDENRQWLKSLPSIIERVTKQWSLELGKVYLENTTCSFVADCTLQNQNQAVLKIGLPHAEARDEIAGLILLNGDPTVQLLKCHIQFNAMLLERCMPGTSLKIEPEEFQDEIICNLLPKIWITKLNNSNFRMLATMVDQWNMETFDALHLFPDPQLAKEGCQLKEELIKTTINNEFLATDLHAGNVLKSQRQPWLAIDLKPYIGDRNYDLTQHLMNCLKRLEHNPIEMIERLAYLASCDPFRLKQWMFARLASENRGIHQHIACKICQC